VSAKGISSFQLAFLSNIVTKAKYIRPAPELPGGRTAQ